MGEGEAVVSIISYWDMEVTFVGAGGQATSVEDELVASS